MKSIEEIEKLSIGDLEMIASDESVAVPEGLEQRIASRLEDSMEEKSGKGRVRLRLRIAGIAAGFAVIAGIGIARLTAPPPLKDTFDDPREAYAALEAALGKFTQSVAVGQDKVQDYNMAIERSAQIINKTVGEFSK